MKFFSLIYQGDVHTAEDTKVIAQKDYSQLIDAAGILEKAKEDAAAYKKQVEEECAALKVQAKQEGFEEGLAKFNEHLFQFEHMVRHLRHELHQAVLPLALKAAKKIVASELSQHPEKIVDIVLQALSPVSQNRRISIYVNKADKEILEAEKPRIKNILEHLESLSIQERADVAVGGCIIETEKGIINASIENQWRALEAAFERYARQKPGTAP